MRRVIRIGVALMAALAAMAVATAVASAALPEELGAGKGSPYTTKGGKMLLETVGKTLIKCEKHTGSGEVLNEKESTLTLHFTGCTASGLATNSLGDAAGTILTSGITLLCYLNKAAKPPDVGIVYHPNQLHFETPGLSILYVLKGWMIGLVEPVNKKTKIFTDHYTQENGKQKFKKCEGGPEEILLMSKNGGAFETAGLESEPVEESTELELEIMA